MEEYANEFPGIKRSLEKEGKLTDEQIAEIMEKFERKTGRSGETSSAV